MPARAGRELVLRPAGGAARSVELRQDGATELELAPGPIRWHVLGDEGGVVARGVLDLDLEDDVELDLAADLCELTGTLLADLSVATARLSWLEGRAYREAALDDLGRFRFEGLTPGRYSLGVPPFGALLVELAPGERREVAFAPPECRRVTLTRGGVPAQGLRRAVAFLLDGDRTGAVARLSLAVDGAQVELPAAGGAVLVHAWFREAGGEREAVALADAAVGASGSLELGLARLEVPSAHARAEGPTLRVRSIGGRELPASCTPELRMRLEGDQWVFDGLPRACGVAVDGALSAPRGIDAGIALVESTAGAR